jgi:hypothetical protein
LEHLQPRSAGAAIRIWQARFFIIDPRVTEDHYDFSANLSAGAEYALIARCYREVSQ